MNICIRCGESFSTARYSLGYQHCLQCGDALAVTARRNWTVVPMHKSNYVLVTDPDVLKQLNPKRGGM
jgi:predicted  nucleic acid-binding Zn-ribbon protein